MPMSTLPNIVRDGHNNPTVNWNRVARATARKAGTAQVCHATILRAPAEPCMAITFKSVLQGRWFHQAGDEDHIRQWLKDPRTEEAWKTICECAQRKGRSIDAKAFVRFVLDQRREATEYLAMRAAFDRDQEKAFAVQKKKISELLKSDRSPLQLAADLEVVIAAMRNNYIELIKSSEPPTRQDKAGQAKKDKSGRKRKRPGWLRRKTFIRAVANYLALRRINHEIGILTEIAFPGPKVTTEMVRDALRPSTRGGRAKKR
jgi:hypothetical protein